MYRIVFHGQLRDGAHQDEVSARLGKLFRIDDPARLQRLFSGQPVTIKKSLDEEAARKYVQALERAGARVEVVPPLPDTEDPLALTDFPDMPAEDDLSFRTVMQSFSDQATLAPEPASPQPTDEDIATPPTAAPRWRRYWPLAAGAAAALLVALGFMLLPSTPAPLSPNEQASLEQLFAIAGEGSDEAFRDAVAGVEDPDVIRAMHELRDAMASVRDLPEDTPLPEFDMDRLRQLASGDQASFEAAVANERDVDARRLLLELREEFLASQQP